ncbi:MAG TPA: hypothetical protein VGP40_07355, partial [Chthoniobacterales bacterium]|nr:hypothetical protein [Chthoniobacterales bacterium]
ATVVVAAEAVATAADAAADAAGNRTFNIFAKSVWRKSGAFLLSAQRTERITKKFAAAHHQLAARLTI